MIDITIRAFELTDLDDLNELYSRPKCYAETLQLPYTSPEARKKKYDNLADNEHRLVALHNELQKVVGIIGLTQFSRPRRAHAGFIGMAVHDDYQRQGVGSKLMAAALNLADNWLNLTRLELTVFVDNQPAIELYKKNGFVIEGTLRQYAFRGGSYVDTYTMARLTA